jgi:5-methyltetrahydrofolate--homocysteine methyltransferase
LLFPLGELTTEEAEECFYTQACGLVSGGVDGFWIETLSATDEANAAINGIRRASDLPIFLSMSFDTAGKTMMGISPTGFAESLGQSLEHLSGLGANCGIGPAELLETVRDIRRSLRGDHSITGTPPTHSTRPHLVAKSNYGVPEFRAGHFHHHGTAQMRADYARHCNALGVKIIGGCCGTDPATLSVMRSALDNVEIRALNDEKMMEIEDFIAKNRVQPSLSPESTTPSDHSGAGKPSAGPSRSRRRRR